MKINELRNERARLIAEARGLVDLAENENRDFDAQETEKYDALMNEATSLRERLDRVEATQREAAELEQLEERAVAAKPEQRAEAVLEGLRPEVRELVEGAVRARPEIATSEYRDNFRNYLKTGEARALQSAPDSSGGYMVPVDFIASLLEKVRDQVFVRQLATNYTLTTGDSVGRPTIETDMADADWTSEIGSVSEDSTLAFGKRELHPHDLTKLIKVSRKLLRASAINPETIVRDQMAYKFGVTEEKAFMTGNGAGQPLGVFTASDDGIATGRDVSTGNTTTAIGADNLFEVKYSLKGGYLGNARWVFHRDALKQIAKLKDGDGQYLWQPGIRDSVSDQLLGLPVVTSEFAPNTFTTGQYVGILGDFSYYWVATSLNLTVQRLVELYAATGQDGFLGRHAVDGMPIFGEAFARVKLA